MDADLTPDTLRYVSMTPYMFEQGGAPSDADRLRALIGCGERTKKPEKPVQAKPAPVSRTPGLSKPCSGSRTVVQKLRVKCSDVASRFGSASSSKSASRSGGVPMLVRPGVQKKRPVQSSLKRQPQKKSPATRPKAAKMPAQPQPTATACSNAIVLPAKKMSPKDMDTNSLQPVSDSDSNSVSVPSEHAHLFDPLATEPSSAGDEDEEVEMYDDDEEEDEADMASSQAHVVPAVAAVHVANEEEEEESTPINIRLAFENIVMPQYGVENLNPCYQQAPEALVMNSGRVKLGIDFDRSRSTLIRKMIDKDQPLSVTAECLVTLYRKNDFELTMQHATDYLVNTYPHFLAKQKITELLVMSTKLCKADADTKEGRARIKSVTEIMNMQLKLVNAVQLNSKPK